MKINKYPDGSSYVQLEKGFVKNSPITFRINSYEDLWHLNQYVDAKNSLGLTPHIIIPCLIDAQADRRFSYKQSFGLKLVCKFLNGLNATFTIFHPHNPESVLMGMDNVTILDNAEFIRKVLSDLSTFQTKMPVKDQIEDLSNNLLLMSSDAGGYKPLMKLCDDIDWKGETYSASKSRSYAHGESKIVQHVDRDDFDGKDILIIDDISVYGGTFKGLSKLLKARNCGKLYLAVSHMTVQDLGSDPVTNYFDKVFTTNSKFDSYYAGLYEHSQENLSKKNLEIIKLF